jgi:hypothetical protein
MELRSARTYWQMAPPPAHPTVPKDGVCFVADTSPPNTTDNRSYDTAMWEGKQVGPATNTDLGRDQDKLQGKYVIYPAPFRYCGTVGVMWSTKADHATWFGKQPEYIHGIQMLPFQPISIALLSPTWIQRIWPLLEQAIQRSNIQSGWRGLLVMAGAVRDVEQAAREAWSTLLTIPSGTDKDNYWDNGNSKTNALYWVAANIVLHTKRHTLASTSQYTATG